MNRLLLINPINEHKGLGGFRSTSWHMLNLPYLAGVTPDHYKIDLIDENIESFEYRDADVVGITAYTPSIPRAYNIAQLYKKKGIPVIMGGIHVSMMPKEAIQFCDTIVSGEAEEIWPYVLEDFERGNLQRHYRGNFIDLNKLRLPRRDIIKNEFYKWGSIQTSRGCPMGCSFCSVTAFNGSRYRRRPLDSVIEELKQIPQRKVFIVDDNIIGYSSKDREWAYLFFERILSEGIKKTFFIQSSLNFGIDNELCKIAAKAGVKVVLIGIESIDQESLQAYKKSVNLKYQQLNQYKVLIDNIRRNGIAIFGSFIFGSDNDNINTFYSTMNFIKSTHIDIIGITKLTPFPGTKLWDDLNSEDRIIKKNYPVDWGEYRLSTLVFKPKKISIETINKGSTYIRIKLYGYKELIKRVISIFLATRNIITAVITYKYNMHLRNIFKNSEYYKKYYKTNLKKEFNVKKYF